MKIWYFVICLLLGFCQEVVIAGDGMNQTMQSKREQLAIKSQSHRDMLVKLYNLPSRKVVDGVTIRRALAPEQHLVVKWVKEKFGEGWASECQTAFANGHPVSCFIATKDDQIIGFSVYDATAKGVAGPIGLDDKFQGKGLGKALLIETLRDMNNQGYPYAVIGWVAPFNQGFFQKAVDAEVIEGSAPMTGMYKGIVTE